VATRAIVRSAARLPRELADHPRLTLVEADLLDLPGDELARHLDPCHAAISCLGHTISLRGIFGPPRDLVEQAVANLIASAARAERTAPLRLILMGSVSVHRARRADPGRSHLERAYMAALRALVPPARDNQRAADLLMRATADEDHAVAGVVVRPDTLKEGEASSYELHDTFVTSLFRPRSTRMANIGRFMADLVTDDVMWARWQGAMPVIVDAEPTSDTAAGPS
jgi:hypothetical protein